ncbi:MAG: cytidylate kinase-like family protein [Lachnospiraceae bacterium]|uniref:Cytidylate kinase-like family protein n=1 Tax=Candidatus Weimeria bifida TaxID=2599074 RepID=A0A6N7IZN8_9FIRM|nr:cytidylate kinase-like family protein [Candidatus Weimeria bifida]RRF96525.1 MAG: cytidylate kinase-like family protein [Lachnospiraceae bacterium]
MGNKQLLVTISRTYGSGGHNIGKRLSEMLGIDFLDRGMLDSMSKELGIDAEKYRKYDEKVPNPLRSRSVQAMNLRISNSPEEMITRAQFRYIRDKAIEGKSFVLIGRAGSEILKDYPYLVRFFITGNIENRISRIMEVRGMDYSEAKKAVARHDRTRRAYHNAYSTGKWESPDNYELILSSSDLGVERSARFLYDYLKLRELI